VYGETLRLRRRAFVEAAVAQGVGSATIIRRHLLPHLTSLLLVIAALNGAAVVAIGAGPLACIVACVLAFVLIGDGLSRRGSVRLRRSWLDI
jgi:peptide/nickel transport system permease protein